MLNLLKVKQTTISQFSGKTTAEEIADLSVK